MNISKVAQSSTVAVNNTPHSIVGELQKQKMELTKQIETVKGSKDDPKAKAEKIKNINDQIEELNKQIQQAQIDEQKRQMEESQQRSAAKAEQEKYERADETEKTGVVLSASLNNLLAAKMDHADLKDMNRIRVKMRGEMNVAESEIKQSAQTGGDAKYQVAAVAEKGDQLSQVAAGMEKKIGEIDKHIDEAVKVGISEAEKERTRKKDEVKNKDEADNEESVDGQEQDSGKVTKPADKTDEQQPATVIVPSVISDVPSSAVNEIDKENEKNNKKTSQSKSIDILA